MKLNSNTYYKTSSLIMLILLVISFQNCQQTDKNNIKADIIIYGGTSAAITAAVEVVKSDKSVIVVSPDKHLGGLSAGGLDIPNRKTDTNNHGAFSSDNIGMNYDYPEASYERRREIIKQHQDYQAGLLWFVANDLRVPEDIRTKMATWGLAKDEFTDNGNWPHQIYVRKARHMIGEYVTTENDVLLKREVLKPVGMGSYAMDSHNVQRYITPEGFVQNEGDIGVSPPAPYSVSYGSIVPKNGECSNLLVPVCVSSSHIAFGSIRMEPVFMILGQSAAVAASIAIDKECAVQDVAYDELKTVLESRNQMLTWKN